LSPEARKAMEDFAVHTPPASRQRIEEVLRRVGDRDQGRDQGGDRRAS
jgi:hypothetical protein